MVMKFLRWILGTVDFEIKGKFTERFINLTLQNDIALINPKGTKNSLKASVLKSHYKELKPLAKKSCVRMHIVKKHGLPFVLHRNRRRKGLAVGAVLFVAIIQLLSQFVWSVDIAGQKNVSKAAIFQAITKAGIKKGVYKNNINVKKAERQISMELGNKVGWISVNLTGTRAVVEISEQIEVPPILPLDEPCNLKATKAGQILKVEVANGDKKVAVGDGVAKGALLVSGIVANEEKGVCYYVHCSGKIFAEVQSRKQYTIPKTQQIVLPTGNNVNRSRLCILKFAVPIGLKALSGDKLFNQESQLYTVSLNGNKLPIDFYTQNNYEYSKNDISINSELSQKLYSTYSTMYKVFNMWDKQMESVSLKSTENENDYVFTEDYSVIEDIAEKSPIKIIN